ncbi:PA3496 family putative envelope integrity protein [Aeromonas jandaei]|uniref:PA3496 family putative envelope integrity protein n=1 Tax=Aeromonas jandaei TaxID=650 RepID=UPI003D21C56A
MKHLTEAQVMGVRGAMVPPTRRKYHVDAAPSAEQARMARNKASARRAIEEYHEKRAPQRELEL